MLPSQCTAGLRAASPRQPRRAIGLAAPSTSPRRRPRRAIDLAAPSTSPRHRPRRAIDLASPSTSPRHRPRRTIDFSAPSTSPRCRPRSAIDLAAPVDVAAPTGRSPGYPLGNPRGSPCKKVLIFCMLFNRKFNLSVQSGRGQIFPRGDKPNPMVSMDRSFGVTRWGTPHRIATKKC